MTYTALVGSADIPAHAYALYWVNKSIITKIQVVSELTP